MADTIRILVTDPLAEEGIRLMQAANGVKVDVRPKLPQEELLKVIGDYDGLVVRSGTQVTKEVLAKAKRLKVIGRAGAGLDNVDVETASKQGIVVMNAAGGNTVSTAEHTMAMLMALARNVPQACASLKGGKWERTSFMGTELYGKHLGIVGMGKVGTEVAKRALAFGMRLVVYDPYLTPERTRELDAEPVSSLDDLCKKCDYITVHTPLSDETRGLIGAKQIAMMKKGVRLINCARGGIIGEKALAEAVKSGHVAGVALDVFEQEPPVYRELIDLPKVIVTPHLGASTEEAQFNVAKEIAISVRDFLLGQGIRNAVNVPSVDPEVFKLIEPYLKLIEKIGLMQGQLVEGHVKQVQIRYVGELVRLPLAPLTNAFVKGLLTHALQESVNYVNAGMIAKERGIQVTETKATEAEDFANLISTVVETDLPAPPPGTYCIYAIQCDDGSCYIGQTDNLERRWQDHLAGKVAWTGSHKPLRIVHYETFETREEAVRREAELKTGFGRKWLHDLVASGRAQQAGKMKCEIHGTLFTRSDPRIVRMNEFYVDAVPSGAMLIVRNQDKPGMIGRMGTILGSKGINIGWMTLGRKSEGSDALMVFNLDQGVPPEVMEEIRRVPSVLYAKLIKL